MTEGQARARLEELKKTLLKYAHEYYVLDNSSVSDAIYDGLMRELKQIEADFPALISADSPTQRIASTPLKSFTQVTHSTQMLSLNDVFSRADVEAWVERTAKLLNSRSTDFFVDIKMDGLACALIYQDGLLVQGVTRGNGFVGEDVTANIRTIRNIPLRLVSAKGYEKFLSGRSEIRGEIVIYKKDFETLNHRREEAGQTIYANPRNTAAGSVRQLDPKLAADRPLKFRGYDLLRDNPDEIPTWMYAYESLAKLGISVNSQATVFKSVDQVMKFVDHWDKKRHDLPFNTDGLVIKVDDRKIYSELGVVGKNPRAAVAYKYQAEEATSVVKDIILSIGRTGAATPIAVFDPVIIAGTTVKHASLHNSDEITKKDIRLGDTVVIYKAGDIIPQVLKVLTELRPKSTKRFDMEAELARQYPELKFVRPAGEAVYRIKGQSGKLLLKKAIEHFASKAALDIDGMGEKNAAALVDGNLVHDMADIYNLSEPLVEKLDRFAELSASNLIKGIAASKNPPLPRFICGIGIRHVGSQTAIDLAEHFKSLDKLKAATLDELMDVEGIGDIVAESIIGWFADPDNENLLDKFNKLGVKTMFTSRARGELAGKRFAITGTLKGLSREQAAEHIRSLGGTFQSSVGKDTDYLVAGENVGENKFENAKRFGTKVINEADLLKMIDK